MINNTLYAELDANTVTFGNADYRIQNDRGYRHIVVRLDGVRTKIKVKERKWDLFYWYVLDGLSKTYPCVVIDWWVRMRESDKYIKIKNYKNELQLNQIKH